MKQKKILMLLENESFPEDCRVLLEAESLVAAGFSVTVICPTDNNKKKHELVGAVRVYRYPGPWEIDGFIGYVCEFAYSMVMLFLWTSYVFLRHGFDAIHMHTPPDLNAVIPIFFKLFGKKFVYDLHDLSPELYQAQRDEQGSKFVHRTLLWFERLASRNADRLIATNETQQGVQIGRGNAAPKHCYIVRNGPNEAFLGDVDPLPELIQTDKSVVGYVGVIGIQDGVEYLIRALHVLMTKRKRTDFVCVIVGDGPAFGTIQSLADELNLTDFIRFTGRIPFDDVPQHIAAFDVCVTPDHSNAYNDSCTTIKTMEYMALGKPTVCFQTKENTKTAADAALYATNNDVGEFAAKIEELMDDPALRDELGQIAIQRIANGLTWKHQAKHLVALYDDLFTIDRMPTEKTTDGGCGIDSRGTEQTKELLAR